MAPKGASFEGVIMNGFYGGFNFGGNPLGGFDAGAFNNGLNQYLDTLRSQLVQQYAQPQQQNPFATIDARIEEYMRANGYPPRQQQAQQPAALPAPQQQNPMQLVTAAISESVSAADMELIAANIAHVPDWLRTAEGKKFVQQATAGIKKFVGGKGSGAGTDAAPETGTAA